MNAVAAQYTEVLSKSFALTALVADRDRILTVSGSGRRELADRSISQPLEKLMDGRRLYPVSYTHLLLLFPPCCTKIAGAGVSAVAFSGI